MVVCFFQSCILYYVHTVPQWNVWACQCVCKLSDTLPLQAGFEDICIWALLQPSSLYRFLIDCWILTFPYVTPTMKAVDAFLEELIVRRELADNFCFYQPHYDSLKGAWEWARKTLMDHASDKREHIYT